MRFERIVDDPAALGEVLARRLEAEAAAAMAARGHFSLALPGGSVAERFLPAVARAGIDWRRTLLFQTDERAVPPGDPRSNFALLRRLLGAVLGEARVFRMRGEDPDLEGAAASYDAEVSSAAGAPPVLDCVLLGVGADGHVASLFPGHPALLETARAAAAVLDAPRPPAARLTLTLPVLQNARLVAIAAFGAEKAAAVRAIDGRPGVLPVARVATGAARTLVLVDAEAAGAPASR